MRCDTRRLLISIYQCLTRYFILCFSLSLFFFSSLFYFRCVCAVLSLYRVIHNLFILGVVERLVVRRVFFRFLVILYIDVCVFVRAPVIMKLSQLYYMCLERIVLHFMCLYFILFTMACVMIMMMYVPFFFLECIFLACVLDCAYFA